MNKVVKVKSLTFEDFEALTLNGFQVVFSKDGENVAPLESGDSETIIAFEKMLKG
jgi:hypothetical protein